MFHERTLPNGSLSHESVRTIETRIDRQAFLFPDSVDGVDDENDNDNDKQETSQQIIDDYSPRINQLERFSSTTNMTGRLDRPSAPVFLRANHFSIDLEWEDFRLQDETRPESRKLFDASGAAKSGTLIYLSRREKRSAGIWETIYTGSALAYKVENLKPNTAYEFRLQYKTANVADGRSDWSPVLQASTTPEPMTGETIYKAIATPGKDQLEKLLAVLGPNHRLLEQPDKDGNLPLMHACAKLDITKVELLVKAGANVNSAISSGKTPLIVAASAGFSKACHLLVENGADVYTIDRTGASILHHAIDSKNFETVSIIVRQLEREKELEMNRPTGLHGWTPLFRAVMHDCGKETIEILLKNGASVHCEDKSTGTTALQMAVIRGNLTTTQLLVDAGADTRVLSKVGGKSLRQLAISTNKTDLINYISALPMSAKSY